MNTINKMRLDVCIKCMYWKDHTCEFYLITRKNAWQCFINTPRGRTWEVTKNCPKYKIHRRYNLLDRI
jgi:hypothetical protein